MNVLIEDRIGLLLRLCVQGRQQGSTTQVLNAAARDGGTCVVVHGETREFETLYQRMKFEAELRGAAWYPVEFVSLNSPLSMVGRMPRKILVDNYAMIRLLSEATDRIQKLKDRVRELEGQEVTQ